MNWRFPTILEPEDESLLSDFERSLRRLLSGLFRFCLAVFTVSHLFEFLFSSVWMHGYIWSLNLPIDLDMTDKPAGAIVRHQLDEMGQKERLLQSIGIVVGIIMILLSTGFGSQSGKNVWYLLKLSAIIGCVCGFIRPIQMKQRFFLSLHEGFYNYFMFFIVSFVLTIKLNDRFPKTTNKTSKINK